MQLWSRSDSAGAGRLRRPAEDRVAWLVLGVSLGLIGWANLTFVAPPALFHVADEGYIHAVGLRLLDGHMLPYVDGVGHRGPLLYWLAAVGAWLFGRSSWLSVRLLALGTMLATASLAFVAARAARRPFAGALAALGVAFGGLCVMYPADGMSYNGEYLLDLFALAALALTTQALAARRADPSALRLAGAGACATLGALAKQNGVAFLPALGLWVLAAAVSRGSLAGRRRLGLVLAFAAGALAPLVVVVTWYAAWGELEALGYYGYRYNVEVYMQVMGGALKRAALWHWLTERALLFGAAALLVLWGLRRPLTATPATLLRRWDEAGFTPTVALGALLGIATANTTLRDFDHYYVAVVPWLGLCLGLLLDHALARPSQGRRRAALERLWIALPLALAVALHWAARRESYAAAQATLRAKIRPVCRALDERSAPGAPLFVWGFRPDLYTFCHRRPASRFVYTTFVAGFVPWATGMSRAEEDRFATPGARELLLRELEASAPPVIVDAPASLAGRGMARYELLAAYLARRYCLGGAVDDLAFWLRRDAEGRCPPPLTRTQPGARPGAAEARSAVQ